jgi:hypothetical protein
LISLVNGFTRLTRGQHRARGLDPPPRCQRDVLLAADDEMVKNPDVEQRQGLLQAVRDQPVRLAGLGVSARMVVKQNRRSCVELQRTLGNHARVDFAGINGAEEQVLRAQDPMTGVEEDDAEDFVSQVSTSGNQVNARLRGFSDAALTAEPLLQDVCGRLEDILGSHLQGVARIRVIGVLHQFFSPARRAPRVNRRAKRQALPHPGVSTAVAARSKGPQQSGSAVEEACP